MSDSFKQETITPFKQEKPSSLSVKEVDSLKQFLGSSTEYYLQSFNEIIQGKKYKLNVAAAMAGPLWAASRNVWFLFWALLVTDILGCISIARSIWSSEAYPEASFAVGLGVLIVGRLIGGSLANSLYYKFYCKWRITPSVLSCSSSNRIMKGAVLIAAIYPLTIYKFSATQVIDALDTFPTSRKIASTTAKSIDNFVDWLTISFEDVFDSITWAIKGMLDFLELLFIGTPWPVMALLLLLLSWKMAGWRVVAFTAVSLSYLGFFGFWDKAMSTMALVGASVCICLLIGAPLGILAAKKPKFNTVLNPILDLMQTMPSFVYLIPAIAFFSVGKPPAVLATVVFAMPPMIRLTSLGIQQVSPSVIEAMLAFGASPSQVLFKAQLPLAMPSIMAGINQSIMMSLSMVVVAALIGAGGLGYDVLSSLQRLEAGKGLLAGLAIVLCAMILDRIIRGRMEVNK
ncbi:glycine/betaine ABC transporter permease [Marinomonas ushuaiensis DSM 15871]|uniref:Glycine/betaine ABC transporter permease n=1 Tax=Marinomonas ushuaiensis DSM 15871 TaxID=1122207 RepID=X7EBD8_9GAMM|nr:proline/glycine betaine ABC transporter permease [Marinomonas ushuaiensis]ETX12526.1 glycine/betaine ABC transporter permease [Marinomonas ushuaiensis DSM 15871]